MTDGGEPEGRVTGPSAVSAGVAASDPKEMAVELSVAEREEAAAIVKEIVDEAVMLIEAEDIQVYTPVGEPAAPQW